MATVQHDGSGPPYLRAVNCDYYTNFKKTDEQTSPASLRQNEREGISCVFFSLTLSSQYLSFHPSLALTVFKATQK